MSSTSRTAGRVCPTAACSLATSSSASEADPLPGQLPSRGAIEIKGNGDDVRKIAESEQVGRYRQEYRQVLVTNDRDFAVVGRAADGQPARLQELRLAPSEKAFWEAARTRTTSPKSMACGWSGTSCGRCSIQRGSAEHREALALPTGSEIRSTASICSSVETHSGYGAELASQGIDRRAIKSLVHRFAMQMSEVSRLPSIPGAPSNSLGPRIRAGVRVRDHTALAGDDFPPRFEQTTLEDYTEMAGEADGAASTRKRHGWVDSQRRRLVGPSVLFCLALASWCASPAIKRPGQLTRATLAPGAPDPDARRQAHRYAARLPRRLTPVPLVATNSSPDACIVLTPPSRCTSPPVCSRSITPPVAAVDSRGCTLAGSQGT